jgi:hypothetical protein
LSDYAREHLGKLYIYYLKVEDSGQYECYLPDGRTARVRLTVTAQGAQPTQAPYQPEGEFAIRVYLERDNIQLRPSQSEEQVCTAMTNGYSLEIEWYNPRGEV